MDQIATGPPRIAAASASIYSISENPSFAWAKIVPPVCTIGRLGAAQSGQFPKSRAFSTLWWLFVLPFCTSRIKSAAIAPCAFAGGKPTLPQRTEEVDLGVGDGAVHFNERYQAFSDLVGRRLASNSKLRLTNVGQQPTD